MGDDRGRREGGGESPAIAEIDGEQHEVAAILGAVRDVHGKLAFLVKWVSADATRATRRTWSGPTSRPSCST